MWFTSDAHIIWPQTERLQHASSTPVFPWRTGRKGSDPNQHNTSGASGYSLGLKREMASVQQLPDIWLNNPSDTSKKTGNTEAQE